MADGEINVAVNAEGVEDAAGEMDGSLAEGEGGGNTGQIASNTGKMARLMGAIVGLLAFGEDILNVLGVVSSIMRAFVAPLAALFLRSMQPILRLLLSLLPGWISWIDSNEGVLTSLLRVTSLAALLVGFWNRYGPYIQRGAEIVEGLPTTVDNGLQNIADGVASLPSRIWQFVSRLPDMIGRQLRDVVPTPSNVSNVGSSVVDRGTDRVESATGVDLDDLPDTVVNLNGSVAAVVEEITESARFDFP